MALNDAISVGKDTNFNMNHNYLNRKIINHAFSCFLIKHHYESFRHHSDIQAL